MDIVCQIFFSVFLKQSYCADQARLELLVVILQPPDDAGVTGVYHYAQLKCVSVYWNYFLKYRRKEWVSSFQGRSHPSSFDLWEILLLLCIKLGPLDKSDSFPVVFHSDTRFSEKEEVVKNRQGDFEGWMGFESVEPVDG